MDQSKAVSIFQFKKEIPMRVRMFDGNPWFVVSDVCKVLDITNIGNAISRLDKDGIRQADVTDASGRLQSMAIANEPNLYRLIFRSDKPEAKAFQDWVYNEVLPSIRKTGQYSMSSRKIREDSTSPRRLLPPAEKDRYIFQVVDRLGIANGRDVGRCCKWYPIKEARRRMAELAEQGELIAHPTPKTVRYTRPAQKMAS